MPRRKPPIRAAYNTNVSFKDAALGMSLNRLRDKVDMALSVASETAAATDAGADDFLAALADGTSLEAIDQYAEFEQGLFGQGGGSLSSAEQAQYDDFLAGLGN
jgi:hypothetical protein